ncbi:MAG: 1-acyl-sn-glycerol-3-phosphate acyltransferase [Cytophagales bacterium]|nr:MAG: 1-acyl-sn-glycerol-3-phosphate acyltransferase [Cytophagales bacterium]TAF59670.1 MAG: 1-acyl-sn-glycerol-3-phosphate acyltransferase [Cytophagales bacterium]
MIFKRDILGQIIWLKRLVIGLVGIITYTRFYKVNKVAINGIEILNKLPNQNVLFVSNHQTYFADVMVMYHIFCRLKNKFDQYKKSWTYLLSPRTESFFIAAEETMHKGGLIPKVLAYAGAITVKRSWRSEGKNVARELDTAGVDKIHLALKSGWVISFPQGTTSPYAPIRKGTAHLIKDNKPLVVPVVIDGFRRAFDKKGMKYKKKGTTLQIRFKEPLQLNYEEDNQTIIELVKQAIEQEDTMLEYKQMTKK